jgi:hypothetical protein
MMGRVVVGVVSLVVESFDCLYGCRRRPLGASVEPSSARGIRRAASGSTGGMATEASEET